MKKLKDILNEVLSEKVDPKVLDAIETIMNNKAGSIRRKAIGVVLAAAKARTGESPRTLKQALQFLDLEESTLNEASMSTDLDTYKIADSFTPQELKRLKVDGKISGEVYNGASELQRSWKQNHPTMRIGGGAYRKEMATRLNEFRPPGKITGEPADQEAVSAERIELELKEVTGIPVKASSNEQWFWRVRFVTKREVPTDKWNKAIKHIETVYNAEILENTKNDYEANWEPEEPAEWVPTIYFEEL